MRSGPLEPSALLAELAARDDPPTELQPYLARLRRAGAIQVYVARRTDKGALFEVSTAEQVRTGACVVMAQARRIVASWEIDWQTPSRTPVRDTLDRLVEEFQAFDKITRFRFAARDMQLTAAAASGLIDAADQRGSARVHERVIETGMVVTYVRPFLPSNEAGLGERWRPSDEAERALHDELIDLRGEYHAHASHTPQRRLEIVPDFLESGSPGRPILTESWSKLPATKLVLLKEMAARQAERFVAEADRLELELFGPLD